MLRMVIRLQLYDSRWNTICKQEAIMEVNRRWSNMGAPLKNALTPLLREIRNAAQNYKEKKTNGGSSE